jgi:hypothetical protein
MSTFSRKFTDVHSSIPNAIRRALLMDTKSPAFDNTIITTNTTNTDNDKIRHRIGLLPVQNNGTIIRIDVKNNTLDSIIINSDDIKTTGWITPGVELFRLEPGNELVLESTSTMGNGLKNAKWCSVTNVGYKQEYQLNYKGNALEDTTVIDTQHIVAIKERLPEFFNNDKLNIYKIKIDTNVIDNFNELINEKGTFSIVDTDTFWLSFETINNKNAVEHYNDTLDALISQCLTVEYHDNTIDNINNGIANCITHIINKNISPKFISIHNKHPLHSNYIVSGSIELTDVVFNKAVEELICILKKNKINVNSNDEHQQ